jgi:hypothetical protein
MKLTRPLTAMAQQPAAPNPPSHPKISPVHSQNALLRRKALA